MIIPLVKYAKRVYRNDLFLDIRGQTIISYSFSVGIYEQKSYLSSLKFMLHLQGRDTLNARCYSCSRQFKIRF